MRTEFVDPGAFRHELTLESATLTLDGAGGHAESWAEVATLYARIEPVSATSRFGADQSLETVTHRITLRHRAGIAPASRAACASGGCRAFSGSSPCTIRTRQGAI